MVTNYIARFYSFQRDDGINAPDRARIGVSIRAHLRRPSRPGVLSRPPRVPACVKARHIPQRCAVQPVCLYRVPNRRARNLAHRRVCTACNRDGRARLSRSLGPGPLPSSSSSLPTLCRSLTLASHTPIAPSPPSRSMADPSDVEAHLPSPHEKDGFGEDEPDADVPLNRRRPFQRDAGDSVIPSQYDPSRTKKIYAPKSQELQDWVKELWWRYGFVGSRPRFVLTLTDGDRYCRVYGKDPTDTLRSYRVQGLYDFFYWMLSDRRGRIKKARTVQTYWNTLTLVRQLETGCFDVEPAVQVEMCGVRR